MFKMIKKKQRTIQKFVLVFSGKQFSYHQSFLLYKLNVQKFLLWKKNFLISQGITKRGIFLKGMLRPIIFTDINTHSDRK